MEPGRGVRRPVRSVCSGLMAAMVLAVSVSLPKGCNLSLVRGRPADLDWLANRLPRLHTNLFFALPEAEYRQALADLRQRVADMDDEQYWVTLWQLLARVGDPNTTLSPPSDHPLQQRYPIALKSFPEGVYVVSATSDAADLLGCRLVSVDGVPVAEAMARTATLAASTASPARVEAMAANLLSSPAVVYGLGVARRKDAAAFVFELAGGSQKEAVLEALGLQGTGWTLRGPRYLVQGSGGSIWWDYVEASKVLYVGCNSFRDDQAAAVGALRIFLDTRPVERIVVDMRRNLGNETAEAFPLVDLLAGRTEVVEGGCVFVLVGQGTAGSAVRQAYEFRRRTGAIFFGEPSGGRLSFHGEVRAEPLPYSGLPVRYSTQYFETAAGEPPAFFEPDCLVRQTAADYFAGRDTAWEAVLAHGRK